MIAIRIDPQVLSDIKQEARRQAVAYQTLINDILADHTRPRRKG
jgi:predicted DNA binding CopG/RHH family protein